MQRAWALGYGALAITDECSVAGVVRAWQALGELERSAETDDAAAQALGANAATLAALHAARAAALGQTSASPPADADLRAASASPPRARWSGAPAA